MSNTMKVPSGRTFDTDDLTVASAFARVGTIEWSEKPFRLRSGIESHIYVHGRGELTEHPELLWLVARKFAKAAKSQLRKGLMPCFIGLPTAGTALASWASAVDRVEKITCHSACWFVMREGLKQGHGAAKSWVARKPRHDVYHYFATDNVVTDGGTKLDSNARFAEDGFDISLMSHLIMIDRQQGAIEKLAANNLTDVTMLWNLLDIAYALGEMGEWPTDRVQAVNNEIETHRKVAMSS